MARYRVTLDKSSSATYVRVNTWFSMEENGNEQKPLFNRLTATADVVEESITYKIEGADPAPRYLVFEVSVKVPSVHEITYLEGRTSFLLDYR